MPPLLPAQLLSSTRAAVPNLNVKQRLHRHRRLCRVEASGAQQGLALRQGQWKDLPLIASRIVQEKMNPLGLQPARFSVAEVNGAVVGFGQIRPLLPGAVELASLTVLPEHRGKGVGGALIQALLSSAGSQDVYLVTIGRRVALYERAGFKEVPREEVPSPLLLEYYAGTVVAKLAVDDRLVVMKRPGAGAA